MPVGEEEKDTKNTKDKETVNDKKIHVLGIVLGHFFHKRRTSFVLLLYNIVQKNAISSFELSILFKVEKWYYVIATKGTCFKNKVSAVFMRESSQKEKKL
jgi:hypothetical protein